MNVRSVKSLEQIVESAEDLALRLTQLRRPNNSVRIPDAPVPLTLEGANKWLAVAEECCRKPRIAKSKQLLREKGIETAAIPADVLDKPESVIEILSAVEDFPHELQQFALDAIGPALTKGFDDANTVVETFVEAAKQLAALEDAKERRAWAFLLVATAIGASPHGAAGVVEEGSQLCQLCDAAERRGVELSPYCSLTDALESLTRLAKAANDYEALFVAESLPESERTSVQSMEVEAARTALEEAGSRLRSEKLKLQDDKHLLKRELELIGGQYDATATTVAELRVVVKDLKGLISSRRQELRSSLGGSVFEVVECMSGGTLPSPEQVDNGSLGAAIRKAIECGYRISLEAPHED